MRIAAVPIRALVSHTRSQVFEVQKVDRAVSRSLSFWSPWRSAKTIHPAETGPSPLKRPAERSAYGVRWRDDYR